MKAASRGSPRDTTNNKDMRQSTRRVASSWNKERSHRRMRHKLRIFTWKNFPDALLCFERSNPAKALNKSSSPLESVWFEFVEVWQVLFQFAGKP